MRRFWRFTGSALVAVVLLTLMGAGPASAGVPHGGMVGAVPSNRTPHVLDNTVLDLEQVGNRIVVAGTFTRVRDAAANGGAEWAQPYVFAFDPATGAIDRNFAPRVTGQVNTVLAGPNGSVFLGGTFFSLNGQASRNLVNVSLATGVRTNFRAPAFNGAINDLAQSGGRLLVAGIFTTAGGVQHGGLASIDASSGALDEYMGIDVTVNANWPATTARASVGVSKIDVSPDGTRLVAIGNFRYADGLTREQAVMVQLESTRAVVHPNWRTQRYEPTCSTNVDSYVRDIDFAPDGSHFVIVTTGAGFAGTLCDSAARWDTTATGQALQPTWIAYTGGDTLLSVAVTDAAVYVGGHQRWMNNPTGRDAARAGAVPRPGLAALDPRTGVPLAWNPGRNPRGVGAEALLATATGLYVGMDTEYFGNYQYRRPRLGYFPLVEGTALPSEDAGQLPRQVFLAGRTSTAAGVNGDDVRSRFFDGVVAGTDTTSVTGGTDWSRARGAFLVGETLFYGYPGTGGAYYLFRRTFDGTTFGPPTQVDPYNDPAWSTVTSGENGVLYRGMVPSFYGQLPSVTSMAYRDGRLYYTLSNSSQLLYRYFSVDSGVVSQDQFVSAASGFGSVSGLILSGQQLYVASSTTGELRRMEMVNGVPSGTPTLVSGPNRDGRDWRTRALFLGPRVNQPPTAAVTASCLDLVCTFDGRGSTDPDGTVASYAWDFGDGTTGTGATSNTTYASAGTRTVRLTVTDNKGATATTTRAVTVTAPSGADGIAHRAATGVSARGVTSVTTTVPTSVEAGDALVLVLSTSSTVTGAAPAGWRAEATQVSNGRITAQVFSRVATAADAGTRVTVPLSGQATVTVQLSAYSGTDPTRPVAAVTGAGDLGGTAHATPLGTVAEAGSWVVSVWSDKQAAARSWTAPAGVVARSSAGGVGNGDMATLLADSGSGLPSGPAGGLTATVPTASNAATMLTVILSAGSDAEAAGAAPEALFSSSCNALACTFDGTESTGPDGTPAQWSWDFGDGRTGTGAVVEHTFAAAGDYTVTLRVTSDGGRTGTAAATVPVAPDASPTEAGIALRGSAGTATRTVSAVSVTVPDSVRTGDGLVLVLSTNSTVTGTAPAGFSQAASVTAFASNPTTQVFQRVAGAGDAGSELTVVLSGGAKVTLQLLAYSGTAAAAPIASVTTAESAAGTSHATPGATVGVAGSWVLSVWSDKQAEQRSWTPPTGVAERSHVGGLGSGDIATLVADSGGPVAVGSLGGLTATVPTASNRAVTLTVVLAPSA